MMTRLRLKGLPSGGIGGCPADTNETGRHSTAVIVFIAEVLSVRRSFCMKPTPDAASILPRPDSDLDPSAGQLYETFVRSPGRGRRPRPS